ncbi:replication-associated recombination protein A [Paucibacter sp. DJ2R-2]|uniref:replication-associated recombination protein A n=1 Tax=Paucibacter sp. DJ2R-2 TaxID=2893558 RepID=UPI0021E44CC6|nr:replication-associated recombination protein A [Paucibacter sp. DJ2R-2]MCV2423275.1 replication-associated recombination protein A [Paucibacter sp. DJ4R-1]MCV2440731.1 replication-associated recombination protein A [Paucibacter sp. DJ2R-2]
MNDSLFPESEPAPARISAPGSSQVQSSLHPPLAERLRPQHLDEVIGQRQLLGPGMPLRTAFESGRLHSMILWGPPGVGKTTLARLMAQSFEAQFISISAVLGGVKDIRDAVERALSVSAQGRRTVLFVDEVHRFNKSQQDAFLPHVESGLFTFIGATTENPSFEVNSALLSRATVHVLKALDEQDLLNLVQRGTQLLACPPITPAAAKRLAAYADGDARRLLNAVESVASLAPAGIAEIDEAVLERALGEQLRRYDKGGEQFYDVISALHKSVRGSDPDAALYWFARMLDGGVDARYIARRLIRMASEDIGLADPRALRICLDAAETYERLGSPEGELTLAQALVFLAVAPKSNAVYSAYKAVRAFVKTDASRPVPLHLRNAPTRLMSELGYGREYRYAHDEPEGFAAGVHYLPDGLEDQRFYEPVGRGLELRIGERLAELRRRNEEARGGDE